MVLAIPLRVASPLDWLVRLKGVKMGKSTLSLMLGGLCASAWWSVAVFGVLPYTMVPAILTSILVVALIFCESININAGA